MKKNKGLFLKYIWLKDSGCLKEAEFQFDRKHEYQYNVKTNRLTAMACNHSLPKKFWEDKGRIVDIHAVVGDNGRGKTTFLRTLMDLFTEAFPPKQIGKEEYLNEKTKDFQAVMVLGESDGNLYKVLCFGVGKVELEMTDKDGMEIIDDWLQIRRVLERIKIAYLSNVFDIRDYRYPKAEHISDYSFGGLMARDFFKQVKYRRDDGYQDPVNEQVFHDIYRQVSFMTEFYQNLSEEKQKEMFDSWPRELHLYFLPRKRYGEEVKQIRFSGQFEEILRRVVPEDDMEMSMKSGHGMPIHILAEKYIGFLTENRAQEIKEVPKQIKYLLCRETFQNLLIVDEFDSYYRIPGERRLGEQLIPVVEAVCQAFMQTIAKVKEDETCTLGQPCLFYEFLQGSLSSVEAEGQVKRIAQFYDEMLDSILKLPEDLFEYNEDASSFRFLIRNQTRENIEKFNHLLLCYKKIIMPNTFLGFDWGMSSGENHMLSFYSRLFAMRSVEQGTNIHEKEVVNYIRELTENEEEEQFKEIKSNSLWLLIDEADLTYHPRWQKKLVADMCSFIPRILPDNHLGIHVILTTHSPILLGDIPKGNVLYLAEEEGRVTATRDFSKNTFGQNIYVLFQDSFFLEDPLGQFASGKLQEMLDSILFIRNRIDKLSNQDIKQEKELLLRKLVNMRKDSQLFGDQVIQSKLRELLDVCEYRLESLMQDGDGKRKERRKQELEKMRYKKIWLERQIAELEREGL